MSTPEADFARELEIFRTEAEAAIQFFYAWLAIHAVAGSNDSVTRALNQTPLFWNTTLGALQTATLVTLGRIFDSNPESHNIGRLLRIAQDHLDIFSKPALAARKRQDSRNADEWLPRYLRDACEPTSDDFRRLKRHVARHRKIYEATPRSDQDTDRYLSRPGFGRSGDAASRASEISGILCFAVGYRSPILPHFRAKPRGPEMLSPTC